MKPKRTKFQKSNTYKQYVKDMFGGPVLKMKYVVVTRDGRVHRYVADAADKAEDKLYAGNKKRKKKYSAVDIAAIVGYNEPVKCDKDQMNLFKQE